jgi:hypothetical protein
MVWNATANAMIAQAAVTPTNAGGFGLSVVETPFTMPAGARVIAGWNYINAAVGPAGAVYESVYRNRKGFSGTNIYYFGGSTVTTMATDIAGAGTAFWATYFHEIIARQQAAGGTGRVLVWVNGGINGPSSYSQWTLGMQSIIDAISSGFSQAGGAQMNLAILCSVTHPTNAPETAAAESVLEGIRTQAETWVDTMPDGVTYVNLAKIYSANGIVTNDWYAGFGTGQAHLKQAGYFWFSSGIVSRLLAYHSTIRCPGDLDGSGEVDAADLGMLLLAYGPCTDDDAAADLDGSGEVDSADLGLFLLYFGPCS